MTHPFTLAALLYHGVLIGLCVPVGRRWMGSEPMAPAGPVALLRDAVRLLGAALALAVPASLLAPLPFFGLLRLICQFLFGEALLLSAVVALVRARRGAPGALLPGALAVSLLGVYVEAYHLGPQRLETRHYRLELPGAPGLSPLRLVHVSDLQTDRIGAHERRAARQAMEGRPDLIVMTGDYLHPRLAPLPEGTVEQFRALMNVLAAPLGVWAVPGDSERDGCAIFSGTRVICLEDEVRILTLPDGQSLAMVGLSRSTSRRGDASRLERLLARSASAERRLVFGHAPDFVASLPTGGDVDLALAGHTHGGQVVIPGFGPPLTLSRLPRRYAGGLHRYGDVPLHVSRGIGMERGAAPQIRFFCPPELSVIDLVGTSRAARELTPRSATGGG